MTGTFSQQTQLPTSGQQEFSNAYGMNFRVQVARCPNVTFFAKSMPIPGVRCDVVETESLPLQFPLPGNKLSFDTLRLGFFVDEYWYSWEEIFRWVFMQANPENMEEDNGDLRTDITVTVLTNNKNPFMQLTFVDAFPIAIDSPEFDTAADGNVLTCTADFAYTNMRITRLPDTKASSFTDENSVLQILPSN